MRELAELDDESWHRVLDLNVTGALRAIRACLAAMRAQRYGRIVLTSSITGPITGQPGFAHYGASKAAMLGLMRSAALELAGDGITINAVLPGNVRTEGLAATSEATTTSARCCRPSRWAASPSPRTSAGPCASWPPRGRLHHRPDPRGRRRAGAAGISRVAGRHRVTACDLRARGSLPRKPTQWCAVIVYPARPRSSAGRRAS